MNINEKGRAVFSKANFKNGDIVCRYEGELCSYSMMCKRNKEYEICGAGCYILEFKFQDKHWAIDAIKEDGSFDRLINHSNVNANVKPVVIPENGVPSVYLVAVCDIVKDDEIHMIMVMIQNCLNYTSPG